MGVDSFLLIAIQWLITLINLLNPVDTLPHFFSFVDDLRLCHALTGVVDESLTYVPSLYRSHGLESGSQLFQSHFW